MVLIPLLERAADFAVIVVLSFLAGQHVQAADGSVAIWRELVMHSSPAAQAGLFATAALACIFWLDVCGTYRMCDGLLQVKETACLIRAVSIPTLFVMSILLFTNGGLDSALRLLGFASIFFLGLLLQKHLFRAGLRALRRRGSFQRRVLIYGRPGSTQQLNLVLKRAPKLGMRAVAIIDSTPSIPGSGDGIATLRNEVLSKHVVRAHDVEIILVVHPHLSEDQVSALRTIADETDVSILFVAKVGDTESTELDHFELDGQLFYGLHEFAHSSFQLWAARSFDIVVSAGLLMVFALPMAVTAVLVYLSSPGPILFRQVRIGLNGKPFTILKFRTMYQADCGDAVSPLTSNDLRITPVGRILRKLSLDELPQLLNVLAGQMSMVGPRPEMPFIVENYRDAHRARLKAKPGLTGLWQISEHRARPIHENIQYDLYYLKHKSLFMDTAIILHTLLFAVRGI